MTLLVWKFVNISCFNNSYTDILTFFAKPLLAIEKLSMEITKVVLFVTTILFPVDCFVRVDNYQNSVYIQKNLGDPFTPASSITFLEPAIFDYMSVDTETAVEGVSQRGHLVQFYKYMYRKGYLTLFPQLSLRYYFTNEQYYQNVSKILMEQMTDNPVIRVRT
ncbi:uncharacterized protein [Mytilus edulis]|uniref:uncharacterized protein n=1 Tax=Mytilus edulis TaxID=6550 RepID=UPI0039EEAF94